MTYSRAHKSIKDKLSHYLCPLHLMSPVIKIALSTRRRIIKFLLFKVIGAYDRLYRGVFLF